MPCGRLHPAMEAQPLPSEEKQAAKLRGMESSASKNVRAPNTEQRGRDRDVTDLIYAAPNTNWNGWAKERVRDAGDAESQKGKHKRLGIAQQSITSCQKYSAELQKALVEACDKAEWFPRARRTSRKGTETVKRCPWQHGLAPSGSPP